MQGLLATEALKELKARGVKYVKIGCSAGSSFFFAGALNQVTLQEANRNAQQTQKDILARVERKLQALWNAEYIERYEASREKRIQQTMEQVVAARARVKNFVPMQKRRCYDVYPSILEKDCYIVILEGSDRGEYWTIDEYENKNGTSLKGWKRGKRKKKKEGEQVEIDE